VRLIFDPSLPDSARQLTLADFWDGLGTPSADAKITVSVEIQDFEGDLDVLALLMGQGALPDPRRTPGAINPAVTQETIRSTIGRRGKCPILPPGQHRQ
jgi:hypothetical protein